MEDETRQLLNRLFSELKTGQDELKMEMNAVYDGQEELKNDIENSISAVKDEISAVKNDIENSISDNIIALETKINAGQEELREEINAFQERIRNIEAGQAAFEERVTCTVDTQLRDMSSMVEQQTRNLREDLSRNIEATRQD
jgi:gas vesicle protein